MTIFANRQLWVIEFTRIYMDMVEVIILPSLPALALYLLIPIHWAQLLIPAFLIGKTLTKLLILSGFSERHDKKSILIYFILFSILGSSIALIPNIYWVITGRLIEGMGIGCVTSISTALVKENFSGSFLQNWTRIGLINVWVPLMATFVGGVTQSLFGWQANFILLILLAGVCVYFLNSYIEDQPTKKNYDNKIVRKIFFEHPAMVCEMLAFSLIFSGQIVIYTITPILFIHSYHWPAHLYWIIILFFSVGLFLGKGLVNRFNVEMNKFTGKLAIFIFAILASAGLVFLDLLQMTHILGVLLLIGAYGVAVSALSPLIRVSITDHFSNQISQAAAFLGILQSTAGAISSIVVACYFRTEPKDMGLVLLFISTLALVVFVGSKVPYLVKGKKHS